jgi:hypothetical protein
LKNPKIEAPENETPALIVATLNNLNKRYISAQERSGRENKYQRNLYDESIKISQLYLNEDEDLFYNGFVNESCFFLACQYSLPDEWHASSSNAQQDLNGTDFIIHNGKRKYKFDVTISADSYARKLAGESAPAIILPIYSPTDKKTYTQLLLKEPSEENYKRYLEHIVFHNRRILNNDFSQRFDIEIIKKKNGKALTTIGENGSLLYHIKIQKAKYRKIKKILKILEQSTTP